MESFAMGPAFLAATRQAQTLQAPKYSMASSVKASHLAKQRGTQQSRGRGVHTITRAVAGGAVTSLCSKRTGRARAHSPRSQKSTGQCECSATANANAYHCNHELHKPQGLQIEPLIRIIVAVFLLLSLCSAALSGTKEDVNCALAMFAGWRCLREAFRKR
eukprot:TRINITY_DN99905_c0_g1_i1.p1 TRINITY_DN99905_c0_g1~~TRINITY_DN99905_c0_g1_i1.p1  ORF type:complete len:161 (-),score=15.18 TRINITY_DN99905_c0_g1_i1:358-840(-)